MPLYFHEQHGAAQTAPNNINVGFISASSNKQKSEASALIRIYSPAHHHRPVFVAPTIDIGVGSPYSSSESDDNDDDAVESSSGGGGLAPQFGVLVVGGASRFASRLMALPPRPA